MKTTVKGVLGIVLGLSCGAWGAISQDGARHPALPMRAVAEEQRVDINHASMEELLKVPGMTKTWAGRIVRFRPYRSKLDLVQKGIVSGEVYNRIKDYIVAHRKDSGQ